MNDLLKMFTRSHLPAARLLASFNCWLRLHVWFPQYVHAVIWLAKI